MKHHHVSYIDQKNFHSEQLYKIGQKDIKQVSHRSIGAITMIDKQKRQGYSNGILLSRDIVLTAAFSIYNTHQKDEYKDLKFYLPQQGKAHKYYQIQDVRYPPQFKTAPLGKKLQFNYALLKLKGKVDYDEFPQISFPCGECLKQKNKQTILQIYGYPFYKGNYQPLNNQGEFVLEQYGLSKKNNISLVEESSCKIGYSINTQRGHGGSPIMINKKVIGIHIGSGKNDEIFNVGRLVQEQLIVNIIKMCVQMKGTQFTISQPTECQHRQDKFKKLQQQKYFAKKQRKQQEETDTSSVYHQQNAIQSDSQQFKGKSMIFNLKEQKEQKVLQLRWEKFISESKGFKKVNSYNLQTNNLKLLDLSSHQKFKLTQKDMLSLEKINLPFLTDLLLDNNRIKDGGLQIICRINWPELKKISLDDNAITINGLKFILFNNWSQKVKYFLYSVQSNDNGFYLRVGECLPIMKKILNTKNMNQVDYLIPLEKSKTLNAMNLLLLTPLDNEDPKKFAYFSQQIQQKYIQKSSKDIYSLASVLVRLKSFLGSSLKFSEKSNIKSKLSSKIIFTGLLDERVRFTKKLKKFRDFHFSEFKCNYKRLLQFEAQYMEYLRKEYNVLTTDMSLDKVTEGCIEADTSDSFTNASSNNQSFFSTVTDEVKIYFENLLLTQDQFDQRGNYTFPSIDRAELQSRGGFPYYQPVLGKRFGIKVQNLYDKGNNDWLMMNGNKNQWAIAFHGVTYPTQGNKIRSIMNGRALGNMLRGGIHQAYKSSTCLKNDSLVGEGIYVSPYFLDSLIDYSCIEKSQKFHLILQCRAKPKSIKIAKDKPDYWVMNNREELRPYGIILFTDQDIRKFYQIINGRPEQIHKMIYKDQFTIEAWNSVHKKHYQVFINRK